MDLTKLHEQLAEFREKFTKIIQVITARAEGEPFYGRLILADGQPHLIGLISNLRANKNKVVFDLAEERLVDGKVVRKVSKQEVAFEDINSIDVFKTISGRPLFIDEIKTAKKGRRGE